MLGELWVWGSGGGFDGDPVAHGGELGDVVAQSLVAVVMRLV